MMLKMTIWTTISVTLVARLRKFCSRTFRWSIVLELNECNFKAHASGRELYASTIRATLI